MNLLGICWRRIAAMLSLLCLCTCAPAEHVRTQLLVNVYADREVAAKLKQVRAFLFKVDASDESVPTEELPFVVSPPKTDGEGAAFLLSFGVAKGKEERFKLVVKGYESSAPLAPAVIEQKAIASFQSNQKLSIHILLGEGCYQPKIACAGLDRTCVIAPGARDTPGSCGDVPPAAIEWNATQPTSDGEFEQPDASREDKPSGARDAAIAFDEPASTQGGFVSESDEPGADQTGKLPSEPSVPGAPIDAGGGDRGAASAAKPDAAWAGCDAVYELRVHGTEASSPLSIPPGGEVHPQVMLDAPWGSETVQAIAFRMLADNEAVLQDIILTSSTGAMLVLMSARQGETPPLPSDVGVDMPTGPSSLRLDTHYNAKGQGVITMDRSGIAVCVVKGAQRRPKHAGVTRSFMAFAPVLAPANTIGHVVSSTCTITNVEPLHLVATAPFARSRARHVKFTVKKSDGSTTVLRDAAFQAGIEQVYPLRPEVTVAMGDQVITSCTFDNDTNSDITFGEGVGNEICLDLVTYYPTSSISCSGGGGALGSLN